MNGERKKMSQTRKQSVVETVLNVGSGYFIAMALNLFFLPLFVVYIAAQDIGVAGFIGIVYTGVSMARSFVFRRLFNRFQQRQEEQSLEFNNSKHL